MTDDLAAAVARLRDYADHCITQRATDIRAVLAALEAAQADAARYRWLRNTRRLYLGPIVGARRDGHKGSRYILSSVSIGRAPHDTETLDAAIDAARAKVEL